jgi:hypothetical protein
MYPTLGNHEAAPCNLYVTKIQMIYIMYFIFTNFKFKRYPPPFVVEDNINWLYSAIAKNWTSTG